LNTGCTIDHHNVIGCHVHIAPGVHLGGDVEIGDCSLIGIGASVKPGMRIGKSVTVGAGSVIIHDIPDHQTVAGVPARPITRRK
jgi:acetyltransferase-like isoleucine patch superfamily enzyme